MSKATSPKQPKSKQPIQQQPETEEVLNDTNAADVVAEEKPKGKTKGWFGNQDKEKKYDLSILTIPKDHYVVRHFSHVDLANGEKQEDRTTNRFQVYDKATFESMSKQTVKDGKQLPSQFQELGMNVDILHKP